MRRSLLEGIIEVNLPPPSVDFGRNPRSVDQMMAALQRRSHLGGIILELCIGQRDTWMVAVVGAGCRVAADEGGRRGVGKGVEVSVLQQRLSFRPGRRPRMLVRRTWSASGFPCAV